MREQRLTEIGAVRDNKPKPPLLLEDAFQIGIAERRHAVNLVVGGHDALCAAEPDRRHERRIVVFIFQARRQIGIIVDAVFLKVICAEVLERRQHLEIAGMLPRHAGCQRGGQFTCKERILAVSLLGSAPARIALHIDRRAPDAERAAVILIIVRAAFRSGDVAELPEQIAVKGRSEPHGLRKDS